MDKQREALILGWWLRGFESKQTFYATYRCSECSRGWAHVIHDACVGMRCPSCYKLELPSHVSPSVDWRALRLPWEVEYAVFKSFCDAWNKAYAEIPHNKRPRKGRLFLMFRKLWREMNG